MTLATRSGQPAFHTSQDHLITSQPQDITFTNEKRLMGEQQIEGSSDEHHIIIERQR